jgi:hypothetical protein
VSVFSLASVVSQTRKGIGCVYAGTTNWKQHLLAEVEGVPCLTLVPRLVPLSPYSYRNMIKLDENEILQFKTYMRCEFSLERDAGTYSSLHTTYKNGRAKLTYMELEI